MEGTWVIKIAMGNDAMQNREDAADMIRSVANWIETDEDKTGYLQDLNGNTVAHWEFRE